MTFVRFLLEDQVGAATPGDLRPRIHDRLIAAGPQRRNVMALQSQLFQGDRALEACLVQDSAHIVLGAKGEHVAKIQTALVVLDGLVINATELVAADYGPSTAAAVLTYKTKRGIINRAYQTRPDNIVGKMTIGAMDREVHAQEQAIADARTCVLVSSTPVDAFGPRGAFADMAVTARARATPSDADIMAAARKASKSTLRSARDKLFDVANAIRDNKPLSPPLARTFRVAAKWLNLDTANQQAALPHLDRATQLMGANINIKTSANAEVALTRIASNVHAMVPGSDPDQGVRCGTPFFTVDGPNCRRDVLTHEFFHFLGVAHGGGILNGPTIRSAITTPAQALNSADNLAQLVAELETPGGRTDACARARE